MSTDFAILGVHWGNVLEKSKMLDRPAETLMSSRGELNSTCNSLDHEKLLKRMNSCPSDAILCFLGLESHPN